MRGIPALVVAIVLGGALQACGSPETTGGDGGTGAKVATLSSAAATPSTAAESKRPRYRMDMTPDEKGALMEPYYKCLKDHGYTFLDAKKAGLGNAPPAGTVASKKELELRACEAQYYPLPEWEIDPANPEAADFDHAVDQCLKRKDIDKNGDVAKMMEATDQCQREIAADKKY
ncbi:hypothetical protein DMB66_08185 [Actinoplanes sp. ATCC 53533]|nr:hypothetical protein DMB66_08185 [Actinoplanes sp. ATCC 53533]